MLLVTRHTGQLCNQIWSLLPIISYVEHTLTKVCVVNARRDYVELFPALRRYRRIVWIHLCGTNPGMKWTKMVNYIEKCIRPFEGALCSQQISGIRGIDGWEYRHDISYIKEQKETVLQLFEPQQEVKNKIQGVLQDYDGITIGVHIRRGDYKNWCGGAYYYPNEVYLRIMKELNADVRKQGKHVRFLICSNEPFDVKQSDLDMLQIPMSDGITDLYGLARCDYIIGPPSSYSQWASFYGEVPLCFILNPDQNITYEDFSPIVGLDTFANGKRLEMNDHENFYLTK